MFKMIDLAIAYAPVVYIIVKWILSNYPAARIPS